MHSGKIYMRALFMNLGRKRSSTSFLHTLNHNSNDGKDLYEPRFESKRKYPEYELINVRLQGYDFVALEKFQSLVHRMAKRFKFTVEESFAVANKSEKIKLFKTSSHIVATEFDLKTYDRWLRISQVPSIHLPLFTLILQTHAPIGTTITIKEHDKTDEEIRYIPDVELKKAQEELKSLDNLSVRKMLGWE